MLLIFGKLTVSLTEWCKLEEVHLYFTHMQFGQGGLRLIFCIYALKCYISSSKACVACASGNPAEGNPLIDVSA